MRRTTAAFGVALAVAACQASNSTIASLNPIESVGTSGLNPHPVQLQRPIERPLSPMAQLGKAIFFDPRLSVSGRQSCASCHDPAHAFGPPDDRPAQFGGPDLRAQGQRAVPGLTYLEAVPWFQIALEGEGSESGDELERSTTTRPDAHPMSTVVANTSKAPTVIPQGGLFWDGRVNTLNAQAAGPLLNPSEMGNTSLESITAKLKTAPYRDEFAKVAGAWVLNDSHMLATQALFAVSRYQIEDISFHPFTSKFDYWLEGRARFTPQEQRGYEAFNDPGVGNCAACHVDTVHRNGSPPLFTDYQFEALGVPRNADLAANRDPAYFDLGLCGPVRIDLKSQTQYCGLFRTPSLRNVATRKTFFHNGRYHSLKDVLAFYDFRETAPQKVYPAGRNGRVEIDDDLPAEYRTNVDTKDAPFDRHAGDAPAMSERDMNDIIAFFNTLTDGYEPGPQIAATSP